MEHFTKDLIHNYTDLFDYELASQLLWSRTTHVGCASVKTVSCCQARVYIVCNYGPGGNVEGEAIFEEGETCSRCGAGEECVGLYDSLCG